MRKKKWLVVLVLLAAGGLFWAGRATKRPVPLPVLPPEVILVSVQKDIALSGLPTFIEVEVPVHGPPPKAVEVIRWRTRDVPVPVETVRTVEKWMKSEPSLTELSGRVLVDAVKFEGLDGDRLAWGWKGQTSCEVTLTPDGPGREWFPIVSQPFDLSASTSLTTLRPKDVRPYPWRLGLRLGATSEAGIIGGLSFHKRSRFGFFVNGTWRPASNLTGLARLFDEYDELVTLAQPSEFGMQLGIEFTIGRK